MEIMIVPLSGTCTGLYAYNLHSIPYLNEKQLKEEKKTLDKYFYGEIGIRIILACTNAPTIKKIMIEKLGFQEICVYSSNPGHSYLPVSVLALYCPQDFRQPGPPNKIPIA